MKANKPPKPVKLDGRTGEGGGQLVRVAVALAALTGTPLRVDNVRGNREKHREGKRGGGLKAQHMSGIKCLADATGAEVTGCEVGSKSFEFHAKIAPQNIVNRNIRVKADSAASVLLVFQAILPFFLFAGDEKGSPISITIQGGTNVSFSLSFEYLDQVLLPALDRFGVQIERKLEFRGWSHGTRQIGSVKFGFHPLSPGQPIKQPNWPTEQGAITHIDISIVVPRDITEPLKKSLIYELGLAFPDVEVNFFLVEDSRHAARLYTLLVAHTSTDLRFGRDWLYDKTTKNKTAGKISTEIAHKVVGDLAVELSKGGVVDEYLQDQLIVFQALAEGSSSIAGTLDALLSDRERVDRTDEPFGDGSMHTTTARWVASELLPQVKWIDKGRICEGAGWKAEPPTSPDSQISPLRKSLEEVKIS